MRIEDNFGSCMNRLCRNHFPYPLGKSILQACQATFLWCAEVLQILPLAALPLDASLR